METKRVCSAHDSAHATGEKYEYTLGILCGGQGSRMGGVDKGWLSYQGSSFVETAIQRFQCERQPVAKIVISANRNQQQYRCLGVTVVADQRPGFIGPLAGLEAIMSVASPEQPLVVVACDMPALPDDVAQRLMAGLREAPTGTIVIANDGERAQPLCMALYPQQAKQSLQAFLDNGGRGVFQWLKRHHCREVGYAGQQACFRNVNDHLAYQALISQRTSSTENRTSRTENNAQSLHFGYDPRNESHRPCQYTATP